MDEKAAGVFGKTVEDGVEGWEVVGNPGVGQEVAEGTFAGGGKQTRGGGKGGEGFEYGQFLDDRGVECGPLDAVHDGPVGGFDGADGEAEWMVER